MKWLSYMYGEVVEKTASMNTPRCDECSVLSARLIYIRPILCGTWLDTEFEPISKNVQNLVSATDSIWNLRFTGHLE